MCKVHVKCMTSQAHSTTTWCPYKGGEPKRNVASSVKMAVPAQSSRTGSASSLGNSPTATPGVLNNNHKLWCCQELDFRSGVKIEELNRLIHEFSKQDQREYDDQRALEIHTAKDFIFSMLGNSISYSCLVKTFYAFAFHSIKWSIIRWPESFY